MKCTIEYPYSIGDRVMVFGDPNWKVVGLCASDNGLLFMVEKGMDKKVVTFEVMEDQTNE